MRNEKREELFLGAVCYQLVLVSLWIISTWMDNNALHAQSMTRYRMNVSVCTVSKRIFSKFISRCVRLRVINFSFFGSCCVPLQLCDEKKLLRKSKSFFSHFLI